jgi:hypothetical protein
MLTDRQRQKRRERKSRERRAKQRPQQQRERGPMIVFGTGLPKMSDRVVEFAEPLLATIPKTEASWKDGLYIAAIVWNGIVSDQSSEEIVAQLRKGVAPSLDVVELVRSLTERKQLLFPEDARFIFGLEARQHGISSMSPR